MITSFSERTRKDIMNTNDNYVPIWKRYALTIQEAAVYFGIGEKRIRVLARENKNADFVLWLGTKLMIKRRLFEDYLNSINNL